MLPKKHPLTNLYFKNKWHLIVTIFLVFGLAEVTTEEVSVQLLASLPTLRDIVVKEGTSTLIECNVTGVHDDIQWYNSKGHALGEEVGGK